VGFHTCYGSGHCPHDEAPGEVNSVIRSFVQFESSFTSDAESRYRCTFMAHPKKSRRRRADV